MTEGQLPPFSVPTTPEPLSGPDGVWSEFFGDQEEVQYMVSDLRQRHAAVLEMDGEPFFWMKRMVDGTVCPYWDDSAGNCRDPLNVDAACYNTKYIGGYHFPLALKIGLPTAQRSVVFQDAGIMKTQPMKSWTLWTPRLCDRDMVINTRTGQRYELLNVQETGPWRGLCIVQFFDLRLLVDKMDFGTVVPVPVPGV